MIAERVQSSKINKSSCPEVLFKKGVRNLEKFPGKHLRQSLCFNKATGCGLQLY